MIVSAIVASAKNGVIGANNQIPWYLPADLRYFKDTTQHHHVIMGRNTYASIGRLLPNRTNIIITRDPFFLVADALVVHSIREALELAYDRGETEAFIIGGGQIYEQSRDYWDRVYLTEVAIEPPGEVFFPPLDPAHWRLVYKAAHPADAKNEYAYTFKVLERIPDPNATPDEEE